MRTVRLQDLGERVAEYVGAAEAGETVSVTVEGRVVAQIGPARHAAAMSDEDVSRMGIREGWLTPAEIDWREPMPDDRPPPPDDPDIPLDELMAELARDREDR